MCIYERNRMIQVPSCTSMSTSTETQESRKIKVTEHVAEESANGTLASPDLPCRRSPSYISANHPLKIAWDVLTILLSLTVGVYTTHASMRDQCFPHLLNNNCIGLNKGAALPLFFGYFHGSTVVTLYDLWRVADIVLNFLTENGSSMPDNPQMRHRVKLTYLRTWFLIDVITLLSWEVLYVQPVFNRNRKKNVFLKAIGITRLYPLLRATKRWPLTLRVIRRAISMVGHRSSRKVLRYAPKYINFALTGKMKIVIVLRILRHVRLWLYARENLHGYYCDRGPITESNVEAAAAY